MNALQGWLNLPRASRSTPIPGWGQWDRQARLLAHSAPSSRALRELPALTAPGHKVCSAMIATFCRHPFAGNYTPTHHSLRQPSGSCCCNYKPQVRWHWGSPEGTGPAEVLSIYGLWRSIPLGSWIYWFPTTESCSSFSLTVATLCGLDPVKSKCFPGFAQRGCASSSQLWFWKVLRLRRCNKTSLQGSALLNQG